MLCESILADPVMGIPSVTCQMPEPSCASTPRTTFAIEGSTITSRVPSEVLTFGRMSGCASIPRASPITGMMVARTIPFDSTKACVSTVSLWFQPLLELSADRVSHGTIVWAARLRDIRQTAVPIAARSIFDITERFIFPPPISNRTAGRERSRPPWCSPRQLKDLGAGVGHRYFEWCGHSNRRCDPQGVQPAFLRPPLAALQCDRDTGRINQ